MIKKISILLFVALFTCNLNGQIGGESTYAFMYLPVSARIAAYGGKIVTSSDSDLDLAYYNPSLLNQEMSKNMLLSYSNYFEDINYGYAAYAHDFKNTGTFGLGIHYISYGKFPQTNTEGEIIGEFIANEMAINLSYARNLNDNFSVGLAAKPILSFLERYFSAGLTFDLGANYISNDKTLTAGIVARNFGFQIVKYNNMQESVPFELLAGISYKLLHAPIRFHITGQQLQRFDMTYELEEESESLSLTEDDNIDLQNYNYEETGYASNLFGTMGKGAGNFFSEYSDPFFRHIIFGTDILLSENFYVTLSYNYQRGKELQIQEKSGLNGFSFGFGLKVYKFHVAYGYSNYHVAARTNNFTVRTNFTDFIKEDKYNN